MLNSETLMIKNNDLLFPEYEISSDEDFERIQAIGTALGSKEKIRILKLVSKEPMNLSELSNVLKIPVSSVFYSVNQLEKAGFIKLNYEPGLKGKAKVCAKNLLGFTIYFSDEQNQNNQNINSTDTYEVPIGAYTECNIKAPCGMASETNLIDGVSNNPSGFYSPERLKAELLWFDMGYVKYSFPTTDNPDECKEISVSFEVCSETSYFRNDWPSDITVWINDVEIVTYTSPGDFGGRRGYFTPNYWPTNLTQYGIKKTFTINQKGVFVDDVSSNKKITIKDLNLSSEHPITLKIGIKEDAIHKGGINIFGKKFGDYPQDIILKISK